jgi:hypothetical protein
LLDPNKGGGGLAYLHTEWAARCFIYLFVSAFGQGIVCNLSNFKKMHRDP